MLKSHWAAVTIVLVEPCISSLVFRASLRPGASTACEPIRVPRCPARSPSVKEYLGIRHRWSMRVNFPIGKERESFVYTISDSLVVADVIEIACHLVTLAKDFDR